MSNILWKWYFRMVREIPFPFIWRNGNQKCYDQNRIQITYIWVSYGRKLSRWRIWNSRMYYQTKISEKKYL